MAEVYIKKVNWDKIINFAKAAYQEFKAEIGGMAVVYRDDDGDWVVTDPIILKQEVTGGTCSLDKTELAKYYTTAGMKWIKKEFRFCWWHSHHTMAAFWSKTDTDSIDEYSDGDISFALVVNLKEEYKFRISIWKPFQMHEDVTLNVIDGKESKIPKKIVDDVRDKCTKPALNRKYVHTSYGKHYGVDDAVQTTMFNDSFKPGVYEDPTGTLREVTSGKELKMSFRAHNGSELYDAQFNIVWDQVSEWMDALVDGELEYAQYLKFNGSFNRSLTESKSKYRALDLPDPVTEELLYTWAEQYIAVQDPKDPDTFCTMDDQTAYTHGY